MPFTIRPCRLEDIPRLLEIWSASGLTLGPSDAPAEVNRFLLRNPETTLVLEEEGIVVGGALGGFDGRRGLAHHLAVAPEARGRGYARALMEELDARYRRMGVVKYSFWIEAGHPDLIEFYRHLGYELRDLITMSKTLIHG